MTRVFDTPKKWVVSGVDPVRGQVFQYDQWACFLYLALCGFDLESQRLSGHADKTQYSSGRETPRKGLDKSDF